MGVMLDDTVHDVLVKDSTMLNAIATATTDSYWNGDGFVTERGVYNVCFENTRAAGNADGGYDLKSKSTVLVNVGSRGQWPQLPVLGRNRTDQRTGIDPHKRGGSGEQIQIDILNSANVTITGGQFVDLGSAPRSCSTAAPARCGSTAANSCMRRAAHAAGAAAASSASTLALVAGSPRPDFYSTNGEILPRHRRRRRRPDQQDPVRHQRQRHAGARHQRQLDRQAGSAAPTPSPRSAARTRSPAGPATTRS